MLNVLHDALRFGAVAANLDVHTPCACLFELHNLALGMLSSSHPLMPRRSTIHCRQLQALHPQGSLIPA